ncbi:uncharacterized protein [Aegilops tauschii subsp. strangulata]
MSEFDCEEGTMEVKFRASLKDPSVKVPVKIDFKKIQEDIFQEYALIARSMPNDIITQDPTPKKIFLDTVRLLAERTDNLVDEIWNYVKDGKLVQSAVLLLSAQAQIRGGCSSKRNGNNKRDGFDIIMCHIVRHLVTLRSENKNTNTRKLREEERIFMEFTGLLVDIVSQAGEALSAYIQAHSKVPHVEVLERVSSILKEYGFCPTGEIVDVKNLCPYNCCVMSDEELYHQGLMNSTKGVTGTDNPCATMEEAAEKYLPKGWDNTFTRRKFFPYWRSVLQARAFLRVYPSYATADASRPTVPTPVPGHKLPSLGKAPQLLSNRQSRRLFGTGASAARSALGYEELRRSRGSSMDSTPSQIHNLSLLVGVAQVTNDHGQSRRLFGTAASILLKVARKV